MRPAVRRPQEKVRPAIRRPQTKMETSVEPAIWRPQEKVQPAIAAPTGHSEACHCGAHSTVSHRRPQVWSAVVALTVRPAITALTMFINIKLPSKTNIPFKHNITRLAKLKMSVKKTTFLENLSLKEK